jgi:hypothetical protein
MNKPLDPFILSLSEWEHVGILQYIFVVLILIGAIGFLVCWFSAAKTIILGSIDAWKNKRGWFWAYSPHNPFAKRFVEVFLKAWLFWLIAGWPIMLIPTGLASEDALDALFGKVVTFGSGVE